MLISFLKFIHVLTALALLGSTLYCLFTLSSQTSRRLNYLLLLTLFALMTGTLIVYPFHFTFHTPWIKAAYVLILLFSLGLLGLKLSSNRRLSTQRGFAILLISLLLMIIHDAVTRSTFLPGL